MSKTTEWVKDNWTQLAAVTGIAAVVVYAALQFWGGEFVDERIVYHVSAKHSDSVKDIPVMQNEIIHIKNTMDEIKAAQIQNQQEILNLLRNMPR